MNSDSYKDTEIGKLPGDWEVSSLGDLFNIKQGKSLSPKHRQGVNPKPFLRTSNVFWGKIDISVLDRMDFTNQEVEDLRLKNGDLLVCEGGDIGRTAMWQNEMDECCYQNHLHRLRKKREELSPEFYMFWMQAAHLILNLYGGHGNKTTIPNLSQSRLKSFLLPVPHLSEQQKIAAILSKIKLNIDTEEKIINRTKDLKKSLTAKLFTEGLHDEELKETEIGQMPKSWEVVKLEEVCGIVYGAQAAVAHATDSSIGTPIFTNINITNAGKLDLTTLRYYKVPDNKRERLTLRRGDILFNWRSGSKDHVGKTALFNEEGQYTFSSFILRFRVNEKILNTYLFYFLQQIKSVGFFSQYRQQSSVNSVFNASAAAMIPVALPTIEEQKEIARVLNKMEEKLDNETKRKSFLEALFKSTLHQLMTGRIRVNDLVLPIDG